MGSCQEVVRNRDQTVEEDNSHQTVVVEDNREEEMEIDRGLEVVDQVEQVAD